jgi:hypothetical protein
MKHRYWQQGGQQTRQGRGQTDQVDPKPSSPPDPRKHDLDFFQLQCEECPIFG